MPSMLPGLPPFAPVSMRLLDILSREDAIVEQVAELMRLDAHFVGEVMRLANSPVFGFQRKIRSLAHVVALLGVERLRAMAAGAALKQSSEAHRELEEYWRHSVASGFLAVELADAQGEGEDQGRTTVLPFETTGEMDSEEAQPAALAENAPVESLTDVVGQACGISGELGFSPLPCLQQGNLDELLSAAPEPLRRGPGPDPARLARALEEKIRPINN